ncbi:MAG: UDP-glucose 4-epimerase GalE [Planctomycetota bacterium]
MRVLVTGGAGYIGSHVVRALRHHGHDVVVLDDLSTGHAAFVERNGVPLVEGDVGDRGALRRAFTEFGRIEAVLHIAGKALAPESVRDPQPYFHTNVAGPIRMLELMRELGVRRIVFSSTCAVYGTPPSLPITETCPRVPISPYGTSKLAFEFALEAYRAYGLRALPLRYFNVAGASDDGLFGELHDPETHLIPNLLKAALQGSPFKLFGTDYPTRDGSAERDYLHVEDLARAHVLAVERLDDLDFSAFPGALNLGTGRGVTVREMLAAVEQVTSRKVLVGEEPRRPGDPAALVADPRRAQELLGWRAEHDLESMVASAHRFHAQAGFEGGSMRERRLKFGELAIKAGYVGDESVQMALKTQRERDGIGESHKLLGLILLEMGAISNEQLIDTLRRMNEASQRLKKVT